MSASMTASARRELVEVLRQRYAAATRQEKVNIPAEFASVSGLHRKSATKVSNTQVEPEPPIKRAGRPRLYDQAVQQGWSPCGKRQIEFAENGSKPCCRCCSRLWKNTGTWRWIQR